MPERGLDRDYGTLRGAGRRLGVVKVEGRQAGRAPGPRPGWTPCGRRGGAGRGDAGRS